MSAPVVYTLPAHRAQHTYPRNAPADCRWCRDEDYRRTQAIAAWEAVASTAVSAEEMTRAMNSIPPAGPLEMAMWEAVERDIDARRAATGLGRLLVLIVALALIGTGIWVAFNTAPMSGGHLIGAPALIVLGAVATYAALKETP